MKKWFHENQSQNRLGFHGAAKLMVELCKLQNLSSLILRLR
jgi:hypothetical protein